MLDSAAIQRWRDAQQRADDYRQAHHLMSDPPSAVSTATLAKWERLQAQATRRLEAITRPYVSPPATLTGSGTPLPRVS